MDEALRLDAAVPGDGFHLRQAQLTGQHHAGEAQLLQLQRALQGMDAHLGGAVAGQFRGDLPDELCHRQVLADDGIRAAGGHCPHGIRQLGQFGSVNGGVQRHMHLDPAHMAEADGLLQAVRIKVSRAGAGVEARKPQIHGVRTAEHGGMEHLFTAHRGKDLNLRHSVPSLFFLFLLGLRGLFAVLFCLQAGQLLPQGCIFTPERLILSFCLILRELRMGCIRDIALDLAAHILGAAGALAVLVQIVHGAEHRRLGHRKIFVSVQQLCDILVQLFGQRGDILFRIRRCDRIGRARNVHSHFINHRILTLHAARPLHGGSGSEFPGFSDAFSGSSGTNPPAPEDRGAAFSF